MVCKKVLIFPGAGGELKAVSEIVLVTFETVIDWYDRQRKQTSAAMTTNIRHSAQRTTTANRLRPGINGSR
jgi:membrane protein involved in colicin uptake